MAIIILNKWEGGRFQNGFTCDYCGCEGTVALICGIKLCAACLNEAIKEINAVVLEAAVNPDKTRQIEAQYH